MTDPVYRDQIVRPRTATYRIQLTPDFGFAAAAGVVDDLARLGVSHLYLSPVAEAVTGSRHGYDVVDPAAVREALGGRAGLWRLAETARHAGLGLVIDLVPNHVSTAQPERNRWWWALLAEGPGGTTADHFDVDWEAGDGRVIVPILGRPLEAAVARGEVVIDGDRVRHHERSFPLRSDTGHRSGTGAHPESGDRSGPGVRAELDRQFYRLQHWRRPERNVRRFFTIDDLVAIRPEVPPVAAAVHATAADLTAAGLLDGVRIDHIDGLADPTGYLDGLRELLGAEAWILVEKILVGDETLPRSWPADGTTGYEWITVIDHLFTHPDGRDAFLETWRAATGDDQSYHRHEMAAMREVLDRGLRPDLERLARAAARELTEAGAGPVDWPDLVAPLTELTVRLGRYRTYLPLPGQAEVVERAAAGIRPDLIRLLLAGGETTRRWQQLTGPVVAKGAEDRALYRWLPMSAHNEVGGQPGRWSLPLDGFHRHCQRTAAEHPATLLAGSTHDTKRSEDVRARLLALAERPDLWRSIVERWGAAIDAGGGPAARVEGRARLLAFQTAIGAWPIDADRLGRYLIKAAREAEAVTSWEDPDEGRESARRELAELLTGDPLAAEVEAVVDELDPAGRAVSLAQLALRLTAPGVPDLYQGSESWLRTLVDPDNRADLDPASLRASLASPGPKTGLILAGLALRRERAACFAPGSAYLPLAAGGPLADHVIAFARTPARSDGSDGAGGSHGSARADGSDGSDGSGGGVGPDGGGDRVVTVAARFPASRPRGWAETRLDLPDGLWRDVLDDRPPFTGRVGLDELLGHRPAAILAGAPPTR